MKIDRRAFVKSAIAGAAFGAVDRWGWPLGWAQDARPASRVSAREIVLLSAGTAHDAEFAAGVESAIRQVKRDLAVTRTLPARALWDARALESVLDEARGKTLLGLMDDAAFAIFSELARRPGTRLLCLGRHSWGGSDRYQSCHSVVSAPRAYGAAGAIAAGLAAQHASFMVVESTVGACDDIAPGQPPSAAAPIENRPWAFFAGTALGAIAANSWAAQPPCSADHPGQGSHGRRQSAASFVIEL